MKNSKFTLFGLVFLGFQTLWGRDYSLDEIKQMVAKQQQQEIKRVEVMESSSKLFKKYSNIQSMKTLKRYFDILKFKANSAYSNRFVLDTEKWLKYSLLERLKFDLPKEDFLKINDTLLETTKFAQENISHEELQDLNKKGVVAVNSLGLYSFPINDKTRKAKTILKKGDNLNIKYYITTTGKDLWAFVESSNGKKGFVDMKYVKVEGGF